MPSFKDPGTESLAGEGSSHKLLPLCADTHGRLHSLMTLPTGRDLPRGFWDQASESQGFLALITARKQTAHCPLSPGLRESVRNPVHILGRVLSGMICEFKLYSPGSCIALAGTTPASVQHDDENDHYRQKCS